jgi:hypothetical protein
MNLKTLLPLLMAVVAFSCQPAQEVAEETDPKDFVWISTECSDGSDGILLCPYSYLRLFDNGSFTGGALRGYVSGTWTNDSMNQQIWLKPLDKVTVSDEATFTVLQILEQNAGTMQVAVLRNAEESMSTNQKTMLLKKAACPLERDPFRTDHNLWRAKPDKPESPERIKDRVIAYLSFLKMFYQFAGENNLERADTDWFPSPMKMDSPGSITMAYSNELATWNACFYNEAQAVEAYQIISGPFMNIKLKGNPDLNARNVEVIAQLISDIENAKATGQ